MLLKKKNKLIIALAAVAISLMLAVASFGLFNKAYSEAPTIAEESITSVLDDYTLGDTLTVPNSVTIEYGNGKTATSNQAYLQYPNGKTYTARTCILTVAGEYKLIYSANVNGQIISAEKVFNVSRPAISHRGALSVEKIDELTVLAEGNDIPGLKANIPVGETFEWSEPIDLKELGADKPFITFDPYQYSKYKIDSETGIAAQQVERVFVRLTDPFNPSVYVEYKLQYFKSGEVANQMPSYTAGANQQPLRAMSTNLGRDSRDGRLTRVDNELYFVTNQGMEGYPTIGAFAENGSLISLFFDVDTARCYVQQATATDDGSEKHLINDLDAPEIYAPNPFVGFTTGEAILSIYGVGYHTLDVSFDLEISQIGNYEGADLHNYDTLPDKTAPKLNVDISYEQILNGVFVPTGVQVPVIPYTYSDVNLKEASVQVKYADRDFVAVSYDANGNPSFKTDRSGKYTIKYIVRDFSNLQTDFEVVYNAIDCSANDNKVIDFSVAQYAQTIKAGSVVTLPIHEISSLNKYITIKGYYYFDGNVDKDGNPILTEFDVNDPTIKFENVGKYHIIYKYNDIIDSGSYEYELTTVVSTDFEFTSVALPKFFIQNAYYTLDPVYAKVFTKTLPELKEVSYEVAIDGADEFIPVEYNNFLCDGSESVQFKYIYDLDGNTEEILSDIIPIVDVGFELYGNVNFDKYFVDDEADGIIPADVTAKNQTVYISNNAGTKANPVTTSNYFVNMVSISQLELKFNVPQGYSNMEAVTFKLTDVYNPQNKFVVSYQNAGGNTKVICNGSGIATTSVFVGTPFRFFYHSTSMAYTDNILGEYFTWVNNFESDYAYLEICLEGCTGNAGIIIERINGSNIANGTPDSQTPLITVDSSFAGNQSLNSQIVITPATATDIVCPNWFTDYNFTVSLEYLDYSESEYGDWYYVEDVNGVEICDLSALNSYTVILDKLGEYTVTYRYYDQNDNLFEAYNLIVVIDEEKPEIIIDGGYNSSTVILGTLGGSHEAQGFTVLDNLDVFTEEDVNVFVVDPMHSMYDLIDNDFEIDDMTFNLDYYGIYTVYYYIEDSSGNVALASYKVFVE